MAQFQALAQKCITKPASGETERRIWTNGMNSGSDAPARPQAFYPDGNTIYQRAEMLENGGFADGDTVSLLKSTEINFQPPIAERALKVSMQGPEEIQNGDQGSSTVQPISRIVKCRSKPVWRTRRVIAFNILNIGRLKLRAAAVGGSKGI